MCGFRNESTRRAPYDHVVRGFRVNWTRETRRESAARATDRRARLAVREASAFTGTYFNEVGRMSIETEQVMNAAQWGDVEGMRALLGEHGSRAVRADQDPEALTTLHWACATGSEEMVGFLLSDAVGADAGALRDNNFSPLHAAAMNGHAEICRMLLEAGANPDVQTDPQGYCPLHSAAWAGHLTAIRVLLEHRARKDLLNYHGETPAQTAARQQQSAAAREIEAG